MGELDDDLFTLWDRIKHLSWEKCLLKNDDKRDKSIHDFAFDKSRGEYSQWTESRKLALKARFLVEVDALEKRICELQAPAPDPTPPPLPPAPGLPEPENAAEVAKIAFHDQTPLSRIWRMVNSGLDWQSDDRSPYKAYILACLSELVYQQMSKVELRGKNRYRVIPSLMLQEVLERNIDVDVTSVLLASDIPTTIIDTERFVLGTFDFGSFTIIAVRGTTQTLADWIVDFDSRKVNVNARGYHHGFYSDALDALPLLIQATPNSDNPLYCTGHSLGGAVSGILSQIWEGP